MPSGRGLIAAGMETGEVAVYDPVKILDGSDALFYSNQKHTGPVGGLNFNPIQKNLLLSGAISGEVSRPARGADLTIHSSTSTT